MSQDCTLKPPHEDRERTSWCLSPCNEHQKRSPVHQTIPHQHAPPMLPSTQRHSHCFTHVHPQLPWRKSTLSPKSPGPQICGARGPRPQICGARGLRQVPGPYGRALVPTGHLRDRVTSLIMNRVPQDKRFRAREVPLYTTDLGLAKRYRSAGRYVLHPPNSALTGEIRFRGWFQSTGLPTGA
jgi:hypothetical protein